MNIIIKVLLILIYNNLLTITFSKIPSTNWGTEYNLKSPLLIIPNIGHHHSQTPNYKKTLRFKQIPLVSSNNVNPYGSFMIPGVSINSQRRMNILRAHRMKQNAKYIYPSDKHFRGGVVMLEINNKNNGNTNPSSSASSSYLSKQIGTPPVFEQNRAKLPISMQEPLNPFDYFTRGPGKADPDVRGYGLLKRPAGSFFPGQDDVIPSGNPVLSPHQDKHLEPFSQAFNYHHFGAQPLDHPYGPQQQMGPLYQAETYLHDTINRPEPWPMDLDKIKFPKVRYSIGFGRGSIRSQSNWNTDDGAKIADTMWQGQRSPELWDSRYAPRYEPPDHDLAITQDSVKWERAMNTKASVPPSGMLD